MKKLPLEKAKKEIINRMHAQYVRKTKDELIQILLKSGQVDLKTMPAGEVHILLQGLSRGEFGCEIPDNENN